jgi:hypothetical protein
VERAEVKEFAKRERYKKLFKHATSPKSLAPVMHAFRKSCIHTSYIRCCRSISTTPFLKLFPSNSVLLEATGLLLPFLSIPQKLIKQNILLFVDNVAVLHA